MASGVETGFESVRDLLDRPVLESAPDLLGSELVRDEPEGELRARIVETEAYREDDPASHTFSGETDRTAPMFASAGHWYIYLCYGVHWMINVSCGPQGRGEGILIRAAEPLAGESRMVPRRGMEGLELTNGPGKLAEALDVDDRFSGRPVDSGCLRLEPGEPHEDEVIYRSPRVGINEATERPWRFYLDNPYRSEVPQNESGRRRD